jgi:SAM-dependent methyltransferase
MPRLSDEELLKAFRAMGWVESRDQRSKNIFNFLCGASRGTREGDVILDVSAGQSRYLPFFQHAHYVAMDYCVGDSNWDYSKLDVMGDGIKLPFKDNSIDASISTSSFEHYSEPHKVMQELGRVLKPGGKLFVHVPHSFHEHQVPYDVFRYTRFGLAFLCEKAGLKIDYIKPDCSAFETAGAWVGLALPYVKDKVQKIKLERLHKLLEDLFIEIDEKQPEAQNDYPFESTMPQMPVTYLMCASKEGVLEVNKSLTSKLECLKDIMGCLDCRTALAWQDQGLKCESCQREYPFYKGSHIPLMQ